eukprot:766484-Hanusia_phi.AAC.3
MSSGGSSGGAGESMRCYLEPIACDGSAATSGESASMTCISVIGVGWIPVPPRCTTNLEHPWVGIQLKEGWCCGIHCKQRNQGWGVWNGGSCIPMGGLRRLAWVGPRRSKWGWSG